MGVAGFPLTRHSDPLSFYAHPDPAENLCTDLDASEGLKVDYKPLTFEEFSKFSIHEYNVRRRASVLGKIKLMNFLNNFAAWIRIRILTADQDLEGKLNADPDPKNTAAQERQGFFV